MKNFKLDPLGQFTAANVRRGTPCSFHLTAHLHEALDLAALQQAVNDVFTHVPWLSHRMRPGFFNYRYEFLPPPKIVPASQPHCFDCYFSEGEGHCIRVLYGERHFTVENIHSMVDGRGLSQIMRALLMRYFGFALDIPQADENNYARFYNPKNKQAKVLLGRPPAFVMPPQPGAATRVIAHNFDLSNMKAVAKSHSCTISEFMLAHIFMAHTAYRDAAGSTLPICAMLPIDFRSFFPTRTVRNFVGFKAITMPESAQLAEVIAGLRTQFAGINKDYVQGSINEMQGLINKSSFVPFALKKLVMRLAEHSESKSLTTVFSNLGKISLPPEIEQQLQHLEFVIDLEASSSCFSCVTAGNVLTLTVSAASPQVEDLAQNIMQRLANHTKGVLP